MAPSYQYRTAITRLNVSEGDRQRLEETITAWKRGCQLAADAAWGVCSNNLDVQELAYDRIREKTGLKSQHAILASHHAAEAIRSCLEQDTGGRDAKPRFSAPTVRYDQRTMTVFDDGTVSLTTTGDRVRCALALPASEDGYQYQYLDDPEWNVSESTLTIRDGEFFLHLGFRKPEREETAEDGAVLGVDLGMENIAVTTTARFFSGREFWHELRQTQRVRGRLEQVGTRSARRTIKSVSRRERRFATDYLHRVANGIVDEARRYDCGTIVLEDLSGIRNGEDIPNKIHEWAFNRLSQYVEYKATTWHIAVRKVRPGGTSLECCECGHDDRANRRSRNHYRCQKCGMEANADYNAAKNIAFRYVRRGQQSSRRTGTGQCALKSGTVTPNGEFTPYPDGFEAEFADKPETTG